MRSAFWIGELLWKRSCELPTAGWQGLQRTHPHRLSLSAVIIKETFWGFSWRPSSAGSTPERHVDIALALWTPGTCFSPLRAEARSESEIKYWLSLSCLLFSTEVGGIEVKPPAFQDAFPDTLSCQVVSPLVINQGFIIKHRCSHDLPAPRQCVMLRYRRDLTMVIAHAMSKYGLYSSQCARHKATCCICPRSLYIWQPDTHPLVCTRVIPSYLFSEWLQLLWLEKILDSASVNIFTLICNVFSMFLLC